MDTTYHITVAIATAAGPVETGSYNLGSDAEFATATFSKLRGTAAAADPATIRMTLVEQRGPAVRRQVKSIGCLLDEFAANSRIIARDIFTLHNLEKPHPAINA